MEYYVVQPDGSKFGPASLELLNKWAETGRVFPDTVIERVSDGAKGPASMLPGLVLPADAPPPALTPQPGSTPSAPPSPPAAAVPGTATGPATGETGAGHSTSGVASATPPHVPAARGYTSAQEEAMLSKFNWGACLLTWIWGVNHRAYWTFLTLFPWVVTILLVVMNRLVYRVSDGHSSLIPIAWVKWFLLVYAVVWIVMRGVFGMKGNRWAWNAGRFATPKECEKSQRMWGWWGAGAIAASQLAFWMLHFMLPTILASQMRAGRDPLDDWMFRPGGPPSSTGPGSPFGQGFPNSSSPSEDPGLAQMRKDMERMNEQNRKQMEQMRQRDQQAVEDMQNRMRADMDRMRGNSRGGGFPGR